MEVRLVELEERMQREASELDVGYNGSMYLKDEITFKRVYGPYILWDMVYGPQFYGSLGP